MKQVEKLAKEFADQIFRPIEGDVLSFGSSLHDALKSGYIEGFTKALEFVTLYIHSKHRFGTTNEFDILFEEIQAISDTEVE